MLPNRQAVTVFVLLAYSLLKPVFITIIIISVIIILQQFYFKILLYLIISQNFLKTVV